MVNVKKMENNITGDVKTSGADVEQVLTRRGEDIFLSYNSPLIL